MAYTITRQSQWPTGTLIVEVSYGGIDYTNPDALVKKYPGEFETFDDPREAAETTIEICKAWRTDEKKKPDVKTRGRVRRPTVGVGATGGMTMPFEPTTFKDLRAWAKTEWEELEKCDGCGKPLPDKPHRWRADDWSGCDYCSEYCANKEIEYQERQRELEDQEESAGN